MPATALPSAIRLDLRQHRLHKLVGDRGHRALLHPRGVAATATPAPCTAGPAGRRMRIRSSAAQGPLRRALDLVPAQPGGGPVDPAPPLVLVSLVRCYGIPGVRAVNYPRGREPRPSRVPEAFELAAPAPPCHLLPPSQPRQPFGPRAPR